MKNKIVLIAAYLIAILFISVGVSKWLDHETFTKTLWASPLIRQYSFLIAPLLPPVEVAVAILLLVPRTQRLGFIAALTMMIAFTIYNIYIVFFATNVPCACGGIFRTMDWQTHLVVNSLFTVLALIGAWFTTPKKERLKTAPFL